MGEAWVWITETLPPWLVAVIIGLMGLVRFGPKFLKEILSLGDKYKDESTLIRNEYIAYLKSENEKINRDRQKLETEVNYLRKLVSDLERRR